jgi:hypothetical protein
MSSSFSFNDTFSADQLYPSSLDFEANFKGEGLDDLYGINLKARFTNSEETSPSLSNRAKSLSKSLQPIDNNNPLEEALIDDPQENGSKEINQKLEEMQSQSSSAISMIGEFFCDLKQLEIPYKQWKDNLNGYTSVQVNGLAFWEYLYVNHDNFIETLRMNFPEEECALVEKHLNKLDSTYKWTDSLAPLVLNITKFCISRLVQKEFEILQKRFEELKSQIETQVESQNNSSLSEEMDRIQQCMEQLNDTLENDLEEAKKKGHSKLGKIICRLSAIPIAKIGKFAHKKASKIGKSILSSYSHIQDMFAVHKALSIQKRWMFHLQSRINTNINCPVPATSQEQLYHEVQIFLDSLEKCKNIEGVRQKLNQTGITIKIPSNFDDWLKQFKSQRFKRYIVQGYYYSVGKRPFMDESIIKAMLHRRKKEKNNKIEQSITLIEQHISECKALDLTEIETYFKNLHIHLDQVNIPQNQTLTLPPQTKADWDQCVQDKNFCLSLAAQWVDYQETTAQLLVQGLRQALLSKNSQERKFLYFRESEYVVSLASSIIQLILFLPHIKLYMVAPILELFVTDVAKIGVPGLGLIYIFYPLYPDMSFKIDSIIMLIAEHFFAIKYKPNEYSFEGYKLIIQIRWFGFVAITHYLISLFQQSLLWLNMRLIENCIMRQGKQPMENDNRYIQINENYEQHRLNCKQTIKELEKCLFKLQLEDAKLCIHPHMQRGSPNHEKFDPIQNFIQGLENVDFHYFPPEVHDFIEENLGLKLTENNKQDLQDKLEDFFSTPEDELIKTHQKNLAKYLKV